MARSRAARPVAFTTAIALAIAGCAGSSGGAAPASVPAASEARSPATSASPTASEGPTASMATAVLPFPTRRAAPLEHARYAAAPPFDLPLSFETPDDTWESLHLLGEFVDIARFDGVSRSGPPSDWIAFGHPARIHAETEVPADGLTPDEIAGVLRGRDDLETSEPEAFSVAGLDGVRLDLRAEAPDTSIFGGPSGNLSLHPSRDARMGIVVAGGEPLLVLVFAMPGQLDTAWDEARPVLESVTLEGSA